MTTKTVTKKKKKRSGLAKRRHDWAWWETFNAALMGSASPCAGDVFDSEGKRLRAIALLIADATAIADAAHGPRKP